MALEVHLVMEKAPVRRYVGLRSQILRAAASIPANIAEGCGKSTHADLARFSEIALASATELDNHLLFARDTGMIDPQCYAELEPQVAEVRRMFVCLRARGQIANKTVLSDGEEPSRDARTVTAS